jgi:maltose-binding protein MalE
MLRSVSMVAVGCVAAVLLMAAPASAAAKTKSTHKGHSLTGTLEKSDGQTMTVKTSTGEQSLTLAPSAHITQNGKAVQASQLASDAGSHVKVRYTESNGQKQAQAVTVGSAASSKHTKKT